MASSASSSSSTPHFLVVAFPTPGHTNPALQLAKRLFRNGAAVTFATSIYVSRRMHESEEATTDGFSFVGFSDGYDDGTDFAGHDLNQYMPQIERRGSETLRELIENYAKEGREFTHVFYTTVVPWVGDVAASLRLPSTLIWAQPATVLVIYHYYFNGYGDAILNAVADPSSSPILLPGLPPLMGRDFPSYFAANNKYSFGLPLMKHHVQLLDQQGGNKSKVLVNTFDAVEGGPLRAIDSLNLVGIGPLLPSAFLDGHDPSEKSFGGDLFRDSKNYIEWLNKKPKASVVYVSFGSISVLSKQQNDEMARGLLSCGRPFLWVIRRSGEEDKEDEELIGQEELERQGMIVSWCSQVEVLSHPSVGCFLTHCGWNSTLEGLACGVPMVAFPQWTDQITNAKLVEDVWKIGVRVEMNNESGIVEGEELGRCLDIVLGEGEKGEEMRRNADKFKELAREAAKEGGSSENNLRDFLDEITMAA